MDEKEFEKMQRELTNEKKQIEESIQSWDEELSNHNNQLKDLTAIQEEVDRLNESINECISIVSSSIGNNNVSKRCRLMQQDNNKAYKRSSGTVENALEDTNETIVISEVTKEETSNKTANKSTTTQTTKQVAVNNTSVVNQVVTQPVTTEVPVVDTKIDEVVRYVETPNEIVQTESESQEVVQQEAQAVEIIETVEIPENKVEIPEGAVGLLKIEKLGLNQKVVAGHSLEVLKNNLGHVDGTSDFRGNVGILGHNSGNAGYFANLWDLKIDDRVEYSTKYGTKVYKVAEVVQIADDDWGKLSNTEDNRITLITCVKGVPEKRWCIQAVEVK